VVVVWSSSGGDWSGAGHEDEGEGDGHAEEEAAGEAGAEDAHSDGEWL
jgi:hypothetical protein